MPQTWETNLADGGLTLAKIEGRSIDAALPYRVDRTAYDRYTRIYNGNGTRLVFISANKPDYGRQSVGTYKNITLITSIFYDDSGRYVGSINRIVPSWLTWLSCCSKINENV